MSSLSSFFKQIKSLFPNSNLFKDLMLLNNPDVYENIEIGLHMNYQNIDDLISEYEHLDCPTMTCGIITYNEERCIERCLYNISDEFDEIIVVDSESTDNTINIIQKYYPFIKILIEPWRNDFS